MNRVIRKFDVDAIFMAGPGHGAPGVLAPIYREGAFTEIYPEKSLDEDGQHALFEQFSFPGGIGSHCTPETPGSIHEGGELGYVLSHACGAAFDNPDLVVTAVVGDGEAETGSLATSWHISKFLNPIRDGAVLPILNLNGYKINNPTLLARISHVEVEALFRVCGWKPYFVEGSDPASMHQAMAAPLDRCIEEIRAAQRQARGSGIAHRPRWPMIVLRSPKGWTGPGEVNGHKVAGFWRAHQVPIADVQKNPASLRLLVDWLRSYKPDELVDADGAPAAQIRALAPAGNRRMGANPHANGGILKKALRMPDFRDYTIKVDRPAQIEAENTPPLGRYLRDIMKANMRDFRAFGPDENTSNKLGAIYKVSKKFWIAEYFPEDADGSELATDGRVIEMLSEHTLEGMLEGYLLTGRHGSFSTYEAFVHVIDSMFNQHAKWLSICNHLSWREEIASLNLLITSTVWRQDHSGFTHQDPGFLDAALNKSAAVTRIYLPPDVNSLLSVADHCLLRLIHRMAYRRTNHRNLHVRGYKEKDNINTPLELPINNQIARFSLAIDVIDRVPGINVEGAHAKEKFRNQQLACRRYAYEHGTDLPEIVNWRWPLCDRHPAATAGEMPRKLAKAHATCWLPGRHRHRTNSQGRRSANEKDPILRRRSRCGRKAGTRTTGTARSGCRGQHQS